MKNREKYAKDLELIPIEELAVHVNGVANFCSDMDCIYCVFNDINCLNSEEIEKWLDKECEVE